jgi:hypothetical protein
MPFGTRPFRVHIDPAQDGAEIVNGVADRVRAELLRNMGLADLLTPSSTKSLLSKLHSPFALCLVLNYRARWVVITASPGRKSIGGVRAL